MKLNYRIGPKRNGDVIKAFACTKKANEILKWKAELSLDQALLSAWEWQKKNN
jgi:UDP-glucose 4-epimerase